MARMVLAVGWMGVCAVLAGCGDSTSSVGDNGLLRYTLTTTYEVPQGELRDARIVAGHKQEILVSLTNDGRDDVDDPESLVHALVPSDGTTIETLEGSESDPPDMRLKVSTSGQYTIESRDGDEVIDKITLNFEEPASFEVLVDVRGPWEESFERVDSNPTAVEEGSQIVLQPVPLNGSGDRLAGQMTPNVTVDPHWAVTPGVDVVGAYEDGIWTGEGEINFYMIEPATVSFTISDAVSGASSVQVFDVEAVVH